MAFEGAFVKVHLGVQGHHVSGCGHGQRIDFHQHSVFFYGQAHQVLHQGRALVDLLRREPAAKEQLPRLEGPDMVAAVQSGGKDALWRARGHLFNVHAAVGRGHDRQALCAPVQHYGQVQLTGNVRALFYPDLMDLFAFWAGLVRHQLHAQNVSGSGLHRVQTFADLHAAALATAAGVDLRLDHPDRAGQGAGGRAGFGRRGRQRSRGHGHAKLGQQALCLVFVNIHGETFYVLVLGTSFLAEGGALLKKASSPRVPTPKRFLHSGNAQGIPWPGEGENIGKGFQGACPCTPLRLCR